MYLCADALLLRLLMQHPPNDLDMANEIEVSGSFVISSPIQVQVPHHSVSTKRINVTHIPYFSHIHDLFDQKSRGAHLQSTTDYVPDPPLHHLAIPPAASALDEQVPILPRRFFQARETQGM